MSSLSTDLYKLAERAKLLELQEFRSDRPLDDNEKAYYYGKGALDFRDKVIEAIGNMPRNRTALEAFYLLLETFPDNFTSTSL